MQELAILLSSLAGVATATAVNKFPRNKIQLQSLGASSQIKNQINALRIEKDILTKTITRLYQSESEITKIQRDKLLLKYQHQLGIVLARLEKLEMASQHPDLGPVGDGLITLMDQKLSQLDNRLFELSSKISSIPKTEPIIEKKTQPDVKPETTTRKEPERIQTQNIQKNQPVFIPPTKPRSSFELTTLTRLSTKSPTYPLIDEKEVKPRTESLTQKIVEPIEITINKNQETKTTPEPQKIEVKISPEEINEQFSRLTTHKALPSPKQEVTKPSKLVEDEFADEDEDDLDKIKGEIMRALSKLEQAEVE